MNNLQIIHSDGEGNIDRVWTLSLRHMASTNGNLKIPNDKIIEIINKNTVLMPIMVKNSFYKSYQRVDVINRNYIINIDSI